MNFDYLEELRVQSQRHLIDFLNAEIQLGFTFVFSATTERDIGNIDHFQRTKGEAAKAVASIKHFLDRIADPQIRANISDRCAELDRAVSSLEK